MLHEEANVIFIGFSERSTLFTVRSKLCRHDSWCIAAHKISSALTRFLEGVFGEVSATSLRMFL